MRIIGSSTSPFVRKVRAAILEKQLACPFVRENQRLPGGYADTLSPLRKVPLLQTEDGLVLFDSPVILEYLESLGGPPLVPATGRARWQTLRWQALTDGLLESIVRRFFELRRPPEQRSAEVLAQEERRIDRVLASLRGQVSPGRHLVGESFSLADLCLANALEYLALRHPQALAEHDGALADWLAILSARPSLRATVFEVTP